jgi:hypothetical protein
MITTEERPRNLRCSAQSSGGTSNPPDTSFQRFEIANKAFEENGMPYATLSKFCARTRWACMQKKTIIFTTRGIAYVLRSSGMTAGSGPCMFFRSTDCEANTIVDSLCVNQCLYIDHRIDRLPSQPFGSCAHPQLGSQSLSRQYRSLTSLVSPEATLA